MPLMVIGTGFGYSAERSFVFFHIAQIQSSYQMTPCPSPSLTLALLQAREASMAFFRPWLNKNGLTEQQWRVIHILRLQGGMESYQLAEQACVLTPSIAGILSRLEKKELVRRQRLMEDRRRVMVVLTEKGQKCFDKMIDEINSSHLDLLKIFGAKEFMTLRILLRKLSKIRN